LGVFAGVASVYGYVYSTPFLEKSFGIFDTCGVGNLHGWPSVVGGLASVFFVAIDSEAEFLKYGPLSQCIRQFCAVLCTIAFAGTSGYFTGTVMKKADEQMPDQYDDGIWWEGEYFETDGKE
jgi:ammonium transporter Rh